MTDPNSPAPGTHRAPVDDTDLPDNDVVSPTDADLDGSDDESDLVDNELSAEQRAIADDIRNE